MVAAIKVVVNLKYGRDGELGPGGGGASDTMHDADVMQEVVRVMQEVVRVM